MIRHIKTIVPIDTSSSSCKNRILGSWKSLLPRILLQRGGALENPAQIAFITASISIWPLNGWVFISMNGGT